MYQKILLAYDSTVSSAAALRQSVDLARHCKAELHLLGVVVITPDDTAAAGASLVGGAMAGAYPVMNDIWRQDQAYLQHALDTAAHDLGGQGLSVSTSIRFGSPGIEIATCAHEIKADLVVVGHTGKGVLARLFQGSVGAELLNNLPCSLLVATGEA
jgi:nucleotide-binding universal stress UspA family protein